LTLARDLALQATLAKNSFLSNTSHELRTPLNSILGFAQLLGMSDLTVEDHDSALRILAGGRHLLALINELIDIARIESGDINLSLEPVSICPLVEHTSLLMGPLAAERSVTILSHFPNPALAAYADQQRLSQVLVNLISNGIKYNKRGGTITITCQEGGDGLASIIVSDTGRGISPQDLERIFVPFERLEAAQTTIEGTGIGLSLAKALAETMCGQLSAVSDLDEGSTFTITLPRCPDGVFGGRTIEHDPNPSQRTLRADRPPMHVLYIEDNASNIEVVARFLNGRSNCSLQTATSGRAGLEHAAIGSPDLILLDLHLPDFDGEHVLEELKSAPTTASIPVVVMSADATPGVVRRLLANGALAYLTKPIELAELEDLLDSLATTPGRALEPTPTT
jgi:CheY-like chemotaxis protein